MDAGDKERESAETGDNAFEQTESEQSDLIGSKCCDGPAVHTLPVFTSSRTHPQSSGNDSSHRDVAVAAETETETETVFGWVIVFASFVNCFIVGIMFIAFSMLYIEFDVQFGTTKAVSGWIGSLFLATGNICGKPCIYIILNILV